MKKTLLILTFLMLGLTTINAQQMIRQKMRLLKTSYITDAINLTPEEAEKFWPVYNLYTDKIQDLKRSIEHSIRFDDRLTAESIDQLSEKDAQEILDKIILSEEKIAQTQKEMFHELSKIISAKKIIVLQKTEREFNKRLLLEFGKRHRYQGNQK